MRKPFSGAKNQPASFDSLIGREILIEREMDAFILNGCGCEICRDNAVRVGPVVERALSILWEHLTEAQRYEWANDSGFTIKTKASSYYIHRGWTNNVRVKSTSRKTPTLRFHGNPPDKGQRLCVVLRWPEGIVPLADQILAQKLLLESPGGEAEFLAMAL